MMSTGMKLTESFQLEICSDEEKVKFVPEQNLGWYPSALCIAEREKAVIHKNWFMSEYNTPAITVHYC